jgi:hypothetical protein
MPLSYVDLIRLLTADDYPENLKGLDTGISVDDDGFIVLPFQRLEVSAEDRARCTLRHEPPADRESFRREMAEVSREIHERYRRKATD